jgi:hypothetical protein
MRTCVLVVARELEGASGPYAWGLRERSTTALADTASATTGSVLGGPTTLALAARPLLEWGATVPACVPFNNMVKSCHKNKLGDPFKMHSLPPPPLRSPHTYLTASSCYGSSSTQLESSDWHQRWHCGPRPSSSGRTCTCRADPAA